mmetsp:Transcript_9504/g.33670  ORF Transcript_9504/g.33670 Transcript_9504/m.33670 type:complete len:116 (-) Transcript_9504:105-452(-)
MLDPRAYLEEPTGVELNTSKCLSNLFGCSSIAITYSLPISLFDLKLWYDFKHLELCFPSDLRMLALFCGRTIPYQSCLEKKGDAGRLAKKNCRELQAPQSAAEERYLRLQLERRL